MAIAVREGALTEEEFELVVDVFKILKQWRDEAAAAKHLTLVPGEVKHESRMGNHEQESIRRIACQ
ncbi:MAG: hypothetical protein JNL01_13875 [Bdellovibrionales bacterium]|nr:hypothetical protein [Bdellovibrionales bacterium]